MCYHLHMLNSENPANYQARLAQVCSLVVKTGNPEYDPKYEKLLEKVIAKNLFARDYFKYFLLALFSSLGLAISIYILFVTDLWYYQAVNGFLFAFFSVQLGIIGHDLSHGAVFKTKKLNRFFALAVWSLIVGLSERRWFTKHNEHHSSPNHSGSDPDLEIPFALSKSEVSKCSEFYKKFILKRQHYLFWLSLPFMYASGLLGISQSVGHLYSNFKLRELSEVLLLFFHYSIIFFGVFYVLPTSAALAFLIAMFFAVGVYMSLIFAPNHKGEEIIDSEAEFIWEHQITTTRNIKPNLISFYLLGGLSLQIEHHLFPTMSRYKLMQARAMVQQYCLDNNLKYNETTWWGSMREIHQALREAQG